LILEVAVLDIKPGSASDFEAAYRKAEPIISSAKGHASHELRKGIERPDRYMLLVRWERLEDHVEGFRKSEPYQEWKTLLSPFYAAPPAVEHYQITG
jgi:heme-degrading monooxygenase HmoA